ncbi:HAD family hydrolase [Brevibacillus sp. TJ4]|uniref:HAD family hydrolase n=1 Tax=Brevibacillus sp. TJ4 TaxID=3234853 RepID=UPI003BA2A3EA
MAISYAILFDMDGTLLQTETLSTPAFQRTFDQLREQGIWDGPTPSEEQLVSVLGMTVEQVWNTLLPGAVEEVQHAADRLLLQNEIKLIHERVTELYPGVVETLHHLHEQGIPLFVASNGQEKYIEAICAEYGLTDLFTDLYSAGRFQTRSKNDLVGKLLRDYEIKQAVMVGDRRSDIEAGKANGLFTIGCDFGFAGEGELDGADRLIASFSELLNHLPPPYKPQHRQS